MPAQDDRGASSFSRAVQKNLMAPNLYKMCGLIALSHQMRGRNDREEEGSESKHTHESHYA